MARTSKPEIMWNCDRKGFVMGRITSRTKVIVKAGGKKPSEATGDEREFVTVLETVSASGAVISPFVVWEAKSHIAGYYGSRGVHGEDATFGYSKEVYMDNVLRLTYLKDHFKPATRPADCNGKRPTRILLVDGHDSHVSWQVVDFALKQGIHVLCLPPISYSLRTTVRC